MNPYERFLGEKEPMKVLPKTAGQLAKLIDGLTPRQLAKRPAPGKWSIAEIIGHLADTEMVMAARCKWVACEDNPLLLPFDQELWAVGWAKTKEPVTESLERFRVIRQSQVRLFRNADKEQLERSGNHPERGVLKLSDFPPLMAGHDINHLEQITALRKAIL
jgi:DinB superfamily